MISSSCFAWQIESCNDWGGQSGRPLFYGKAKFMRILIVLALLILPPVSVQAQGFNTKAPVVVILDGETGAILFEKDARRPIPPASMTKIMTLYIVFERLENGSLSLDDLFTVSDDAWRRGGFRSGSSTMCLRPKERVRVEDLIRGVIVLSGNDAAITLAENISGSEADFAKMMTARAHELGLLSVNFVNATGWPAEDHEVSAIDLARMSELIIKKFPKYYEYFAEREFDWCKAAPSNRFNRNPLLALFEGADGLKTGHTKEAGYGLVGSAKQGDNRRIIVAAGMNSKRDRVQESVRIMRASFREFEVKKLFEGDRSVGSVKVALGTKKTVRVEVASSVSLGLFKPDARKVRAEIVYNGPILAPIAEGQKVGILRIYAVGQPVIEVELLASDDVAKKGYFSRVIDGFVHLLQRPNKD